MKILILHQHFKTPDTGGALRSYFLAKALVDRGIQTVVLTAHNEAQVKKEMVDGIEVCYLPIIYHNRFGFYRRGYAFIRFVWMALRYARQHRDASLCYAISVPLTVGVAAIRLKKKLRIPFLFEVGDLWPDAPVALGFIKNKVSAFSLYKLEAKIYQEANAIVALSTSIQDAIAKKLPSAKIELIPNMADTTFFKLEKKNPGLVEKYNVSGKFVVSYIGAIGFANGLEFALECARACQKASLEIVFLICGEGAHLETMKHHASNLQLQNVRFLPFQNRNGVREIMNVTDACLTSYKPFPILETGSPNKFFDGLAAGKLSIINFGGWIKEEVEKAQCGFYVDPSRPSQFPRLIAPFLADAQLLKEYQSNGRKLAEEKFSREKLTERFHEIITKYAIDQGNFVPS